MCVLEVSILPVSTLVVFVKMSKYILLVNLLEMAYSIMIKLTKTSCAHLKRSTTTTVKLPMTLKELQYHKRNSN